jgi:hypothetical protein
MNNTEVTGFQMTFLKGQPRPPNAGRKPGTPNKRSNALAQASAAAILTGLTPLDFMLGIVRDPSKDERLRLDAARAAAPYLHPKLQNIDNRTTLVVDDPNKSAAEHRAELAEMLADLGIPREILNAVLCHRVDRGRAS